MFNIGSGELVLIAVVALLVLGPKRLPELARGLGKFLREFRRQTDEVRGVVEREFYKMDSEMDAPPPQLTPATDPPVAQIPTGSDADAPMDHSDPRHPDYGKPDPHVLPEEQPTPVEAAPAPVVNHHTDPTPPLPAEPAPAPGPEKPPDAPPETKAG